ncbi:MAG: hypothetical protein ACXAC2_15225, partial [Candidatus Kariarchaeaceae archaeon]
IFASLLLASSLFQLNYYNDNESVNEINSEFTKTNINSNTLYSSQKLQTQEITQKVSFSNIDANLKEQLTSVPKGSSSIKAQTTNTFQVNDTLTFWAVDYGLLSSGWENSFYQTNATVKAVSNHSYVFIEDNLLGTYDEAFAQDMANEFESNIWDSEVPYFGVPPDVDGNGKVSIFIMDILDGLSGGSYIAGVFLRIHQYDPALHSSDPILKNSMFMEIVHIDKRSITDGEAFGTLAHEFQHLIHYNSDPDETVWIDEAASTFASLKAGYYSDVDEYFSNSDSNYFLFNTDRSLTFWASDLHDYATAFLFFLYLNDRFGPNVIGEITNSSLIDRNSIESILQNNYGYSGDFSDIFRDWTIANALDLDDSSEYGYSSENFTARVPLKTTFYPRVFSESVTFWGTDMFEFSAPSTPSNMKIYFTGETNKDFILTTLSYSSEFNNWTVGSYNSNEFENNEGQILIQNFSSNKISKLLLLVSSIEDISPGVTTVETEESVDYDLLIELSSTEILYSDFNYHIENQTVMMNGIVIADPISLWNISNVVYANYSIVNSINQEIVLGFSNNLTFNDNFSYFELLQNVSNLDQGSYQIVILISNGTLELELFSPVFIVLGGTSSQTSFPSSSNPTTTVSNESSTNKPSITTSDLNLGLFLITLFVISLALSFRRRKKI